MPGITRIVGAALIVLGIAAYAGSGADSPTALIPSALGLVLLVLGVLANKESRRRHAMHAAMLVALLGILGTTMTLAELPSLIRGEAERPLAVIVSAVTAVVLLVYLVVGIRSFIAARRVAAG